MDFKDLDRPRTISELMDFVRDHNLPYEKMRFFIGEDYRGAKAFGIYQNTAGNFVVYKNKANGERAVRYEGPDEEFAVRELWERMCAEIANQKAHNRAKREAGTYSSGTRSKSGSKSSGDSGIFGVLGAAGAVMGAVFAFSAGIAVIGGLVLALITFVIPDKGYYVFDDSYYAYTNKWYVYDEGDQTWIPTSAPGHFWERNKHFERGFDTFASIYAAERESLGYSGSGWKSDFTNTTYYRDWEIEEEERARRNDDDDDDDWDWDDDDDWDSDYTDWDSDW